MAILTATDLGHAYGATDLFHEVNLSLEERDRAALVGPNGIGKTTLLLTLAGLLEPTNGEVNRAQGLSLGYLRQEAVLTFAGQENTVHEEMLSVFADLRRQEADMREMEAAMATAYSQELLDSYGQAQIAFELAGGYQYQIEIKRVLQGLGFEPAEWDMPLHHLSGGQKTRLLMGRLLLEKPDLLILDEPTNHLDIAAIEWLEGTLRRWEGALIVVSHDRYFLDRVATRVWDMSVVGGKEAATLTAYRGNYSAYLRQRDEALQRAQRLFEEEKDRLDKEAEFIRKHIAGGQTDIAKGRLRQLTRDLALIEQVGLISMAEMRRANTGWLSVGGRARTMTLNEAEARIRELRPPVRYQPRLNIRLETVERSSRIVLRIRRAIIGYAERILYTIDDLKVERGQRVALLGPNGSGKSTLLKVITGEIPLLAGDLNLGDDVQVGYFAQAHDQLIPQKRVIDELWSRRNLSETEARHYLAQYLFRGDDVFKRVAELSGGERGRLALALLALEGANFLLLDEPTNHLDIPSQEILQGVLESYNGTILLVSHDRYLIDRLAGEVWSLEEGQLHVYPVTYQEYLAQLQGQDSLTEEVGEVRMKGEGENGDPGAFRVDELPFVNQSWDKKSRRQDSRRRQEIEIALEDAEFRLSQLGDALELARKQGEAVRMAELEADFAETQEVIDNLMIEWGMLA
jgi:ATP-binding cassette, subfamily F, member 3